MARHKQTRGTCAYCGRDFARSGMNRHLQTCPARKQAIASEKGRKTPLFHLFVEGKWAPDYWMHLEIPATLTLRDLDQFLRDIWLECCGHLSAFTIAGQRYEVSVDLDWDYWGRTTPKDMNVRLSKVFSPGLQMDYEYDFGSTTPLKLRVIAQREGVYDRKEPVRILSRNHPPDIRCARCGQPATRIYVWEEYETLCDACGEASGFDDEGWLPVVNSPRAGECGYTGDAFAY